MRNRLSVYCMQLSACGSAPKAYRWLLICHSLCLSFLCCGSLFCFVLVVSVEAICKQPALISTCCLQNHAELLVSGGSADVATGHPRLWPLLCPWLSPLQGDKYFRLHPRQLLCIQDGELQMWQSLRERTRVWS